MKTLERPTLEQLLNARIVDLFANCKDVEELNETEESILKLMDMLYAEKLYYIRRGGASQKGDNMERNLESEVEWMNDKSI